jgi:hypothetical protein
MDGTRYVRYIGAFAAGIFAGSSFALNFGQIQALGDHTVPPRSMVNQFRIWNAHQSGYVHFFVFYITSLYSTH